MGAFFLVRGRDREATVTRMAGAMARCGGEAPRRVETPHFTLCLYPKLAVANETVLARADGAFAFAVGTFFYDGRVGNEALAALIESFTPPEPDWSRTMGSFCAGVYRDGRLHLFLDRLGVYKVYHDAARRVFASRFLAVLATVEAPHIRPQCVYEYVFQGASYGGETVIEEVGVLDGEATLAIGETVEAQPHRHRFDLAIDEAPLESHVARIRGVLDAAYDRISARFAGAVDTALSGGYDSRLTLALLRARGITPRVHVYGSAESADVQVAKAIAEGEGIALEHVDKSAVPTPPPEAMPEIVARNHAMFDGCPADGIVDNGRDIATRRERCANGELMLNGGGGEVFRNFFYLPDRRYSVGRFLWSFYARFDPRTTTARFDETAYFAALAEKVVRTVGRRTGVLDRSEVEYLYPAFRCRYWMGVNNSVNNRLGWALTPFIDHAVVQAALTVPLRHKDHGILEARLIGAIDPRLAAYPSAYGHDFAHAPPLARRLSDWATLMRPPRLRRYAYRLKARRRAAPLPTILSPPWLAAVIDIDFPWMSAYVRVGAVHDAGQRARITTLEYLFERCSPRPPG